MTVDRTVTDAGQTKNNNGIDMALLLLLTDAMRDDPFVDDVLLLGTRQQDMRMEHYARVAIAAWNRRSPSPAPVVPEGMRAALKTLDDLLDFSADIDDRHPLTEICSASEINRAWALARAALSEPPSEKEDG